MIRASLFVLPLLAVGCATPTSGTYDVVFGDTETDCESSDTGDDGEVEDAELEITVNDDATEVELAGYEEPCPLDGVTFTCSAELVTDYNELGAGDAVVTIASEVTGTWKSNSTIDGTTSLDLSCEGGDCEALGVQTCSSSTTWSGTLQE